MSTIETGSTPVVTPAAAPAVAHTNSVVTFIKQLGGLFKHGVPKAIALIQKDEPQIKTIVNTAAAFTPYYNNVIQVENTFDAIFGSVVQVEQVATAVGAANGNGEAKLAAAAPQVEQILFANPIFKNKVVVDQPKWDAAVKLISGAVYDLANSVAAPATPATTVA